MNKSKKIISKLCILFSITMLLFACEEDKIAMHETGDDIPPQNVNDIIITPTPGGAIIKYTLPDEKDLLLVKAEYLIASGKTREASASLYNNELILDGFGDTSEKNVEIYTVDRDRKSVV